MPLLATKSKIGYFKYKSHRQGHKVIDFGVIWKGFISWVDACQICIQQLEFNNKICFAT